jgi:tetratricopeptide (TPR) repeat protein
LPAAAFSLGGAASGRRRRSNLLDLTTPAVWRCSLRSAASHLDTAIALNPHYAEAFNNRGNALYELGRFGEALASCEKAIALKPDYAEAFNVQAVPFMTSTAATRRWRAGKGS